MDRTIDFSGTANERINATLLGFFVQIDGELIKRTLLLVLLRLGVFWLFALLLGSSDLARFGKLAVLANAMAGRLMTLVYRST